MYKRIQWISVSTSKLSVTEFYGRSGIYLGFTGPVTQVWSREDIGGVVVKLLAGVTRDNVKTQPIGNCCTVPRGTVLTIVRLPVLCCNLF